jgi:glycerophosphoryl diester phosphodiesterase
MSTPVILVVFLTFAFAVGRAVAGRLSRYVSMSGVEYLLVGVLVGPLMPWTLITPTTLTHLDPLVELLTGLLGFLLGTEGYSIFRRSGDALVGFVSAFVVALGTAAAVLPVLSWVGASYSEGSEFVVERELFELGAFQFDLYLPGSPLRATRLAARLGETGLLVHPYTMRRDQSPPAGISYGEALEFLINELQVDALFCDQPDDAIRVRDCSAA